MRTNKAPFTTVKDWAERQLRWKRTKRVNIKSNPDRQCCLCFPSDFLLPDANAWRAECWQMMRERQDLHFLFLTKRIEQCMDGIPTAWGNGYGNVTVGCTPNVRELCSQAKKANIDLQVFSEEVFHGICESDK